MDDIVRLELAPVPEVPEPFHRSTNVYLLPGPAPALVGCGHPEQFPSLKTALAEHGLTPDDIERVVHTSWGIGSLGGARSLPGASHFVWSPDLVQPANYERVVEEQRGRVRVLADEVLGADESWGRAEIDTFLDRYFPRVSSDISIVPVRNGHHVRGGELDLEVIGAAGPSPGHCFLWDDERSALFTGDLSLLGLPDFVVDVQPYLVAYERAIRLDPDTIFPSSGAPRKRGTWSLRQAFRFVNNFLENAPLALGTSPTLLEFVERDMGYRPESFVTYLFALLRYKPLLDELVRAHSIEIEGEGIEARRYGIDVDDPRDSRLRT